MNFKGLKESISGEERAVSPVIGVILMVAITVILAAVIGTFVLGLGDNIQTNVQAGASVQSNGQDRVTTTFSSTQDNDAHLEIEYDYTGGLDGEFDESGATQIDNVGGTAVLTRNGADDTASGTITVTVTAVSGDSRTVIVTKEVDISAVS